MVIHIMKVDLELHYYGWPLNQSEETMNVTVFLGGEAQITGGERQELAVLREGGWRGGLRGRRRRRRRRPPTGRGRLRHRR